MSAPTSRVSFNRRTLLRAGAGMAGILATGRAPAFAQAQPKKLVFAHINAIPELAAVAFDWMAKEATAQSKGALDVQFFGKTLIPQELEIMNAVKSGSVAMGSPAGAAATVFPEMGALLVPYLVKDYASAYAMLNGRIGDKLSKQIEDNYKLKVLCYFDYGFRHFWTSKKPIVEPKDLRGLKIRVQQAKIFGDTINGLGGNAVPMAFGEVITAAKQGVIDGGDLPIVNMKALKIYEVSKYASLTYHNYGPTNAVMNLEIWNGLSAEQPKADHGPVARRAGEDPRGDRVGRQFRQGQVGAGAVRHDRGGSQGRGIPAKSRSKKYGRPTRPSTAHCGTRSKASRPELTAGPEPDRFETGLRPLRPSRQVVRNSIAHAAYSLSRPEIHGHGADHPCHRQPAGRRDPALFRRRHHRLARCRPGAVHLGRGSGRAFAGVADADRRRDRHPVALAFHARRVRASPARDCAALDPPFQSRADRWRRPACCVVRLQALPAQSHADDSRPRRSISPGSTRLPWSAAS